MLLFRAARPYSADAEHRRRECAPEAVFSPFPGRLQNAEALYFGSGTGLTRPGAERWLQALTYCEFWWLTMMRSSPTVWPSSSTRTAIVPNRFTVRRKP